MTNVIPDIDIASSYDGRAASFSSTASSLMTNTSLASTFPQGVGSGRYDAHIADAGVASHNWSQVQSYLNTGGGYLSPAEIISNYTASAPPSMISGFSAPEPTQPSTRPNSSYGGNNDANMMRVASAQSFQMDQPASQKLVQPNNGEGRCAISFTPETDLLALGTRFAGAPTYPAPTSNSAIFLSPGPQSMERFPSGASLSSCQSATSCATDRPKDVLEESLQQGRASRDYAKTKHDALHRHERKRPLPKSTYQRPKGPKITCPSCQEHPEGFRGKHELRRHINAKHRGRITKFRCRDPASVGLISEVKIKQPLSECKACSTGKLYGAYYNAAAHLRRTHFKDKAVRGKGRKPDDEKRAGKGGGFWPPMSVLKLWFEECHVTTDECVYGDTAETVVKWNDNNAIAPNVVESLFEVKMEDDLTDPDAWIGFDMLQSDISNVAPSYHGGGVSAYETAAIDNSQLTDATPGGLRNIHTATFDINEQVLVSDAMFADSFSPESFVQVDSQDTDYPPL